MHDSNKCRTWLVTKRALFCFVQEHFAGAMQPGFGQDCLQLHTRVLIGTHNEKVPLTKFSYKGGQYKYRFGVFIYLLKWLNRNNLADS